MPVQIHKIILIILFFTGLQTGKAQSFNISEKDTALVYSLLRQGQEAHHSNPDTAIMYYRMVLENQEIKPGEVPKDLSETGKAYIEAVIRALNYTGNIYYFNDEYNRSEAYYRRSFELSKAAGLKDLTGRALFDLGYNSYVTNDYESAKEQFVEACQVYSETANLKGLFDALNACGLTYRRLGSFEKADSSYRQAMQIAVSMNDSSLLADVWLNAGILLCEQGNLEEGINFFEQALDFYEKTGNKKAESLALLNIGVVMKLVGEFQKALDYIKKSTAIEELLQHKSQLVVRYFNMADLYLDMGENDKAFEFCQKIQMVHNEIGSRPFEAECDFLLGKYYYLEEDFRQADHYFDAVTGLAGHTNDQPLMANVALWHAKTKFQIGNMDQALAMGRRAYDIALDLKLVAYLKETSELLSEVYEKTGRSKEALFWYKTYMAYSDSLNYFNQQKEINRIESRYNYEKKEKENELLRDKSSLQEQQLRNRNIMTIALVSGVALSIIIILLLIRRNRDAKLLYEQQQMLNLKHLEDIELELDGKKRELTSKMMFLNQKNDMISRLIKRLQEIQNTSDNSSEEIVSIVNELRTDAPQSSWKEFEAQFTQVHPGFYQRLYEQHPALTSYEQRICAFLRMNLNTKEISSITGRSAKSIEVTRSRIRTKLNLKRDDNLSSFLASI